MSSTDETQEVAKQYFAAWTSRDPEKVKTLLDEDLKFSFVTGGIFVIEGREKFCLEELGQKKA